MHKIVATFVFLLVFAGVRSQDSSRRYSLHFQTTVIPQYHFDFNAPYSSDNSLETHEVPRTSFSGTAFFNYKPFKHTYFVFNPEAAGGKGLSKTLGIAGFPNGEVYRVGDPKPKPFVARLYAEQRFPLSEEKEWVADDINQVAESANKEYVSVILGKFSLTDFFDDSQISHDPRTQFMNWALMGNGGWDYPANTRGYTMGAVIQVYTGGWAFRTAIVAMPIEANGAEMQFKFGKAMGWITEIEKTALFNKDETHFSTLHAGFFVNYAHMGSYRESIDKALSSSFFPTQPNIEDSRLYGRTKPGFYLSLDNHFGKLHHFIKTSWNDGKNETWAFTEIDRSTTTGFRIDGELWKRKNDHLSIAYVNNGLSSLHSAYLALGGYGFLIGDGKLNYGAEQILEAYYSINVWKKISLTPDYQFILHPAYNKDRGPVNIVALRLHAEF